MPEEGSISIEQFLLTRLSKSDSIKHELADCARIAAELDQRMEQLHTITKQDQGEKRI